MFPRDKGQEEATNGGSSLKNFKKPPVPSETVVANIVQDAKTEQVYFLCC